MQHTGDAVSEVLDYIVSKKLEMSLELPKFAVSDNAANMKKGVGSSLFSLYLCCCHTQQLAILETFKEFEGDTSGVTLHTASETCKRLAAHLHKSNIGKMLLEAECKESGHYPKVIPQSMDVRWDSKYSNFEGVNYHQDCLLRLARKGKLKVKKDKQVISLVPTMEEFELISTAIKVLKICQVTTKIFEQEAVPTLPLVVDRLYTMDSHLKELQDNENHQVSSFCEALRENLSAENRFPNFGMENELNCMGNYLNPTLRGCHLKLDRGEKFEETKRCLEENFAKWGLAKGLVEEVQAAQNQGEQPQVKKLNPTELLKQQLREKTGTGGMRSRVFEEPTTAFEAEMAKYEANDKDAPENTDMLQWWKQHAQEYPRLNLLI